MLGPYWSCKFKNGSWFSLNASLNSQFDTVLAEYISGGLADPARLLVQCHLELNSSNHSWVRDLDILAGCELDQSDGSELSDSDAMLEQIFGSSGDMSIDVEAELTTKEKPSDDFLTHSLASFLGCDGKNIPWKTKVPGIKVHNIDTESGCEMSLLCIKAGMAMPTHSHEGREMTLVLAGGFSDGDGHYVRGDVAIAETGDDHKPVADLGEDCICLVVNDAPLRFKNPITRIISSILPN